MTACDVQVRSGPVGGQAAGEAKAEAETRGINTMKISDIAG